ncbi:MAG: hypothetical protein NVS1B4_21690 [Gemmatimonadaceae bacterium]
MLRSSSIRLLAPIALLLGAACADRAPTAPSAVSRLAGAPRPDVIINAMGADRSWADFTVTPTGGVFALGKHSVRFPAAAICDPSTSTYGPTEWKTPCETLDRPIRIHAELRTDAGRSWVDFTPSLRFVPTSDPARYVVLTMSLTDGTNGDRDDRSIAGPAVAPPILWTPFIGAPGIDEALLDPTLRTQLCPDGTCATRRIEHFTGYVIATGYARLGLLY